MARKVGRPSSLDPAAITKLEIAFKMGANVTEACNFADVTQMSLSRYCKKHPDFREKINLWRANPIMEAKKCVFVEMTKNKNAGIALELLKLDEKQKTRREYGRRWRAELESKRNENVSAVEGLPPTPQEYARKLDDQFAFDEELK